MQTDDSNYGATSAHSRQTTQGAEPASGSTSTLFHVPTRQSYDQDNVDERTQLLGHWSGEDPELTTTANTGSKKSRRRNTWNYNTRQQPSLLPTSVQSMTSISALASRPKDLPGQTTDPEDPLNKSTSVVRTKRESLSRQDTSRSVATTSSLYTNYNEPISARRTMLRQSSFGAPGRFMKLYSRLMELIFSPDTTDEKIISTCVNVVNVAVDTAFCLLYLVEASHLTRPPGHESNWLYIQRSRSFWYILVTIACYNFLTVWSSIIFAESKSKAIRRKRHVVSTLIALPFMCSIFMKDGHELYVPYFLQSIALVSRVQQALNFYIDMGVTDLPMDPLKSKTIIFAMYIITLIYCAISAFQVAEYDQLMASGDHNDLLKLLYFVLITMSTVGYGDLTPKNQLGYAIVVLIIGAVLSVLPFMISGIMDAVAQAKAGEGIFKPGGHKFMIISGSLHSAQKLANVLNGFWFTNKEYSNSSFKIVILGLSEPCKDIQALLRSARYKNRVVYLKGTPLESKDLERIQARYAEGIFIIADRNSTYSPQEEDRHNTLSTLAFRNVSEAGIYTYNLLPETEMYQKIAATQVVCADELRQVLLAFNCLQQASATLVLNMLHQHRPSETVGEAWEAEYDDSLGNEFYFISSLNPIFDGKPFGFVSWFLYRRFQVILFGVRILLQSGEYHTALNPGKDYIFQHNEQCIFIAQNPTDLDEINALTEQYLERFLQHLYDSQEDFDYHAKNFSKALLTLSPTKCPSRKHKKARSSQRGTNNDINPYSRTTGFCSHHSAAPTINHEDDEIDVVPEVSFVSGDEGGADQGSNESASSQPAKRHLLPHYSRSDRNPNTKSRAEREYQKELAKIGFQDSESNNLRIDYPPAPFPGAKVPLCILVDTRNGGGRTLKDMKISSWDDLLKRKEKARQIELNQRAGLEPGMASSAALGDKKSNRLSQSPSNPNTEPGHILICSPNYDIFRLICTLRSSHLRKLQDVVVLCSRKPNDQEFRALKCFPRLYFLIGDCLSREDLERGGITKSSKYLFLRHPQNAGVDGSFFDSVAVINRILVQQIFSDAENARTGCHESSEAHHSHSSPSVMNGHYDLYDPAKSMSLRMPPSTKKLSRQVLNEGPQCVYELVEERSVEFLELRNTETSIKRSNHYTAGSQALGLGSNYYEPSQQQQHGPRKKLLSEKDFYHNAIYASGGVLVGGLLDHVLYQLYSNPSILQLIKLLCGIRTKADVKRDFHLFKQFGAGCYLQCIPVPEEFAVQTMKPNRDHDNSRSSSSPSASASSNDSESSSDADNDDDGEHVDDKHDDAAEEEEDSKESSKNKSGSHSSDSKKNNKKKKKLRSSLSKVASMGKQKVSKLFHSHHHHSNHSDSSVNFDADYMKKNRHKNFLRLYEHFALDRGIIPIGLLRLQGDDPKTVYLGIGGSSRCYAITNPLLDTVLLDTDQVFVLTRESL